jgi:hypothetical protein
MDELKKDRENKAKKVRQPKRKVEDLSQEEVDEAAWRAAHHVKLFIRMNQYQRTYQIAMMKKRMRQ